MVHLRKLLAGLGLGILAALLVLGIAASGDLLERLELTTYDWRMRLAADPASVNKNIALVEINDLSIRELQNGYRMRWPWPRVAIGLAIDFLRRGGAKVIAVDIAFTEHDQRRERAETEASRQLAQMDHPCDSSLRGPSMVAHVGR